MTGHTTWSEILARRDAELRSKSELEMLRELYAAAERYEECLRLPASFKETADHWHYLRAATQRMRGWYRVNEKKSDAGDTN